MDAQQFIYSTQLQSVSTNLKQAMPSSPTRKGLKTQP